MTAQGAFSISIPGAAMKSKTALSQYILSVDTKNLQTEILCQKQLSITYVTPRLMLCKFVETRRNKKNAS